MNSALKSNVLPEEIRERTWNAMELSSPWTMAPSRDYCLSVQRTRRTSRKLTCASDCLCTLVIVSQMIDPVWRCLEKFGDKARLLPNGTTRLHRQFVTYGSTGDMILHSVINSVDQSIANHRYLCCQPPSLWLSARALGPNIVRVILSSAQRQDNDAQSITIRTDNVVNK